MSAFVIWRWVLLGVFRNHWIVPAALALAAWVPLVQALRPFPSPRGALEIALEGAGPAGLLGACLALVKLADHGAFLTRVAPPTRWLGEFGSLLFSALCLQLPICLGALGAGAHVVAFVLKLPDILTADALLAGTALLLLIPPLSTAHRTLLFLAAAWFLPTLIPPGLGAVTTFAHLFDTGAIFRAGNTTPLWTRAAFAAALALLGHLLRTAQPRSP